MLSDVTADRGPMRLNELALLLLIVFGGVLAGCSGGGEAKTQKTRAEGFLSIFGYPPPAEVTDIKYKDVYNRFLLDSAYGEWICCTYQKDVWNRIAGPKSTFRKTDFSSIPNEKAAPSWWPKSVGKDIVVYDQEITSIEERASGFSISQYFWRDEKAGLIYLHKYSMD